MTAPAVLAAPDNIDDDAAWAEYCAALPDPTDAELAAVVAEYANPYADRIAHADEGFRVSARLIWQWRRHGWLTPSSYRYLRTAMTAYAATKRAYVASTEHATLRLVRDMRREGVWS